MYAGSEEIKQYYLDFCSKYDLDRYIRTSQKVTNCRWLEDQGKWTLEIEDLASHETYQDDCDILINAGGYLNHWMWPRIKGLRSFAGPMLHSARWDNTLSLKGKIVGLIGNGSSAVQMLPLLKGVAKEVITFFRSPNWILPSVGAEQRRYTKEEVQRFAEDPESLTALRRRTEASLNSYFGIKPKRAI